VLAILVQCDDREVRPVLGDRAGCLADLDGERDHLVAELAEGVAHRLERLAALVGDEHPQRAGARLGHLSARPAGA
jgi:hypothetical protein